MAIVVETWMSEDLELGVDSTTKTHPGGGTLNGTQISLSTFSRAGASGTSETTTWDPGEIASGSSEEKEITVQGAQLGDFVLASLNIDLAGLMLSAYVSAENTVTASLYNLSGGAVNLGSATLKVAVFETR